MTRSGCSCLCASADGRIVRLGGSIQGGSVTVAAPPRFLRDQITAQGTAPPTHPTTTTITITASNSIYSPISIGYESTRTSLPPHHAPTQSRMSSTSALRRGPEEEINPFQINSDDDDDQQRQRPTSSTTNSHGNNQGAGESSSSPWGTADHDGSSGTTDAPPPPYRGDRRGKSQDRQGTSSANSAQGQQQQQRRPQPIPAPEMDMSDLTIIDAQKTTDHVGASSFIVYVIRCDVSGPRAHSVLIKLYRSPALSCSRPHFTGCRMSKPNGATQNSRHYAQLWFNYILLLSSPPFPRSIHSAIMRLSNPRQRKTLQSSPGGSACCRASCGDVLTTPI